MDRQVRMGRARERLREQGLEALLVGPSADLRWLTGYHALPLERLTLLVVPADGEAILVAPALEEARASASPVVDLARIRTWDEDGDPFRLVTEALGASGCDAAGRYAVQDRLWAAFLLELQGRLPDASWERGAAVMSELRLRKDEEEVRALLAAGTAIDRVHERVGGWLRPGRREREVGRDIAEAILEEHDEVNFVIVGSGPNGASPHHETGDRVIEPGDAVVVDIGGTRDGYCSDMTRNYVVGGVPEGYREVHEVVEAAHEAALVAAVPGASAQDVDGAARQVISDAGYGEYFIHRTGHGIGVEEHEDPYIVAGNTRRLEEGMAFSIEPGIYLPGRYGARIEDIVVVTSDGVDRMNRLSRGLREVGT